MIGIKFKVPNTYDNILYKILNNILCENCVWKIDEDEVLDENNNFLFDNEIYSDIEFNKIIRSEKYYPIFLNLQLYNNDGIMSNIVDYKDFINSDCKLILFIVDNIYVEIYSKDEYYLKLIEKNAHENNFFDIEIINDKNNNRKKFCVHY